MSLWQTAVNDNIKHKDIIKHALQFIILKVKLLLKIIIICFQNFIFHLTLFAVFGQNYGSMLHRIFQFLDGFRSENNLRGYLHIGNDYAVFLRKPMAHDKFLVYELYEVKNLPDYKTYKPKLLAISKIPVEYVKEQFKTFRQELYKAKYVDSKAIPGIQVQTLREWQIERALNFQDNKGIFRAKPPLLRTIL